MEVMIAHPLVLPDALLALDDLEAAVFAWGLTVMRQAFVQAWTAQAALRAEIPCPTCHGTTMRRAGTKPRHLETRFGPVVLARVRWCCRACGTHFQPDDALLAPVLGRGRGTPALRQLAAQCGASWPYRQAAAVVGMVRGSAIAVETVRRMVAHEGAIVVARQQADAARACTPPATAPLPVAHPPPAIEVALDGAWIHSHDNAHGMEIKVGVVHTGSERCGRTRTRLPTRRYAATADGVAPFVPLMTAAIDHLEGFASGEQTLLGDGAAWIWGVGEALLPTATPILDRWHLAEARRRALRAAIPEKETRRPWSVRIEAELEAGAVGAALVTLTEIAQLFPHPALRAFAGYLRTHAARIPDYAARRAAGQTIGSGTIEKGVDLVVNRRLKGRRGMRWWRMRAAEVVALRVVRLNDEWDTSWASLPMPQPTAF